MKILAVDTSSLTGSVAVLDGDVLLAEITLQTKITHSERLLRTIDWVLEQVGWQTNDLQGLGVAIGPGSFTGLRIGLATLKGIAAGLGIPLVGVSSLESVAYNLRYVIEPVVAVLDAKRQEVYAAAYQFKQGTLWQVILNEVVMTPEELSEKLSDWNQFWMVGEGAVAYRDLFAKGLQKQCLMPVSNDMMPHASYIAELAGKKIKQGEGVDFSLLAPNYLRAPDARKPAE